MGNSLHTRSSPKHEQDTPYSMQSVPSGAKYYFSYFFGQGRENGIKEKEQVSHRLLMSCHLILLWSTLGSEDTMQHKCFQFSVGSDKV